MSIKNIITYELSGKWYYNGGGDMDGEVGIEC